MSSTEGKQQKFEVETDDGGDFKIISKEAKNGKNGKKPVTTTLRSSKIETLQDERVKKRPSETEESVTTTLCSSKKLTGKPVVRSKPFIPTGLPKEEIQKIRRNVAIQRISEYVRIVSPDDGIVDEVAFTSWIKWQLRKKFPDKYLEIVKKRGLMVPCGEGKLKFTRSW